MGARTRCGEAIPTSLFDNTSQTKLVFQCEEANNNNDDQPQKETSEMQYGGHQIELVTQML